ncbi:MAG: ABC transporter ATP-binding protein, partial [Chloroflexota bacterium]
LDELLGGDTVRIRATGLDRDATAGLARYGQLDVEADWLVVRGVDSERVPELVAEIVRLGGRVYAVEPRHESLEDRFLQLLGQPN